MARPVIFLFFKQGSVCVFRIWAPNPTKLGIQTMTSKPDLSDYSLNGKTTLSFANTDDYVKFSHTLNYLPSFFQVFGILTKPLVRTLLPQHSLAHDTSPPKEDITLRLLPIEDSAASGLMRAKRSLTMLLERPAHTIHAYWRKFDDTYMRPVFGGPS